MASIRSLALTPRPGHGLVPFKQTATPGGLAWLVLAYGFACALMALGNFTWRTRMALLSVALSLVVFALFSIVFRLRAPLSQSQTRPRSTELGGWAGPDFGAAGHAVHRVSREAMGTLKRVLYLPNHQGTLVRLSFLAGGMPNTPATPVNEDRHPS